MSVIIGFERCVRLTDSVCNEANKNYPTIHLQSDADCLGSLGLLHCKCLNSLRWAVGSLVASSETRDSVLAYSKLKRNDFQTVSGTLSRYYNNLEREGKTDTKTMQALLTNQRLLLYRAAKTRPTFYLSLPLSI